MYFKKTVGIEMLTEQVADRSLQREHCLIGLCLERNRIEINGDKQQYQHFGLRAGRIIKREWKASVNAGDEKKLQSRR